MVASSLAHIRDGRSRCSTKPRSLIALRGHLAKPLNLTGISRQIICPLGRPQLEEMASAKSSRPGDAERYRSRAMNFKSLRDQIDSMMARDPAARSRLEVILAYPSFHALLWHRLAHAAWSRGWRLTGRILSNVGRFLTGIEIHPGAKIGTGLFIDHGLGVVIGETAEVGNDVTLYHDVTLGGVLPSVNSASQIGVKRHPTLKNGVIVGSGAQILGAITIGEGARVGANAVVVKDVPPGVTVVGNPARIVMPKDKRPVTEFAAYGMPAGELIDPFLRAVEDLRGHITALNERVAELEAELAVRTESVPPDERPTIAASGKP